MFTFKVFWRRLRVLKFGVNRLAKLTPYWSEPLGLDHETWKN